MTLNQKLTIATLPFIFVGAVAFASSDTHHAVSDEVIAEKRAALAEMAVDAGFGPQSPRDIDSPVGLNDHTFGTAPAYAKMNLCDIHFHENAEHKGGEFTTFAGNGDGEGTDTGFKYDGMLSQAELAPTGKAIGENAHGDLVPGDTIEIHFVYSSAPAVPGPTLGTCLSEVDKNPDLRVETVVAVLVNDSNAVDFTEMAKVQTVSGRYQVQPLPTELGSPVVYAGSTTGPSYNEKGSPFQVTWSVRPKVLKLDINALDTWLSSNVFEEDHAHGVRNLVINPKLLSPISN